MRHLWAQLSKRGLNRLPGVRPLAHLVKDLVLKWEYRGRDWVELPDGIKIYLGNDPNNLIKIDYIDFLQIGVWEKLTVQTFRDLVKPGDNVVDVGAAFGYLTMLASRLAGSDGRVFSFEPEPSAWQNLQKNIELNQASNVVSVNSGVSDGLTESTPLFGTACGGTIMPGTRDLYQLPSRNASIPLTSMDAFLAKQGWPSIRLLKIDIEGAEILAFRGMAETFERNPGMAIISEINPTMLRSCGFETSDFFHTLQAAGFNEFTDITGNEARPFDPSRDVERMERAEFGNQATGAANLLIRRSS